MALNEILIEEQIGELIDSTTTLELEESKAKFKKDLASIIVNAIKSAQLTIPSGAIITTGSALTQTNAAPVVVISGLA